ncbi:MAG: ribonuclease R [Endozoicomonadaceae bacterium]|nr:ribonuclease R [Endozoicomonadaceae bacterium]
MPHWWKSKDPDAQTEAEKYNYPAPGRAFIINYLQKQNKPLSYQDLCKNFALKHPEQTEGLRRRLIAMCKDKQLIQNRSNTFCLPNKAKNISGCVYRNYNGSGLLITDDDGENFFLPPKQMESLFDGDKLIVKEMGINEKKQYLCQIIKIIKRKITKVIGIFHKENGQQFVSPYSYRMGNKIEVIPGKLRPSTGQDVVIKIKKYPDSQQLATGVITEILDFANKTEKELNIALRSYNIPHQWTKKIITFTKKIPDTLPEKEIANRIDLRHLPFVTIDGEDAKDFDDAVYAETKRSGGWKLYVAIADVSHYVTPGSLLDQEAQKRGNSVYFPNKTIPMLPEKLSNNLCSLKPNEDRPVMVCEMKISANGRLSRSVFYEGVIHSQGRLTYNQVAAMLGVSGNRKNIQKCRKQFDTLMPPINTLYDLYKTLRKMREQRGAIDFNTVETRIIFDEQHKIKSIIPVERNDAHKLIEECMLCANQAAAKFLEKHKLAALFRIHEGPDHQKLKSLHTFLKEFGLHFFGKAKPTPADYQQLLFSIQKRSDASIVQTMLLRSLSQAEYHPDNSGHFGLAYKAYAHFTSPIRRYPDLLVHRAIRYIIRSAISSKMICRVPGAKALKKEEIYPYDKKTMLTLANECSMTERRADEAVRDMITALKCQYIQQHLGEVYSGTIVSVTGFGLFVELNDLYVSGLVHISCLPKDYYHFNHAKQRLTGERTNRIFSLGDILRIRIVRVNIEERNIDFQLEETTTPKKKKRKSSRKK